MVLHANREMGDITVNRLHSKWGVWGRIVSPGWLPRVMRSPRTNSTDRFNGPPARSVVAEYRVYRGSMLTGKWVTYGEMGDIRING